MTFSGIIKIEVVKRWPELVKEYFEITEEDELEWCKINPLIISYIDNPKLETIDLVFKENDIYIKELKQETLTKDRKLHILEKIVNPFKMNVIKTVDNEKLNKIYLEEIQNL